LIGRPSIDNNERVRSSAKQWVRRLIIAMGKRDNVEPSLGESTQSRDVIVAISGPDRDHSNAQTHPCHDDRLRRWRPTDTAEPRQTHARGWAIDVAVSSGFSNRDRSPNILIMAVEIDPIVETLSTRAPPHISKWLAFARHNRRLTLA
jgi:D-alanyl-D-alanine dipeptidase